MASAKGSGILKLEGSARNPTNNPVLNHVVIQNDASTVPNTMKLNGSNYPLWSSVLEMHIVGRSRKGFMIGSTNEPTEDSAEYETWETGNAIVKWWLINSIEPAVMGFFIHLRTAKEVWEKVAQTYYDGSDISQIYELKVKSFKLRQEGQSVEIQIDRVYVFLAGLDDIFDKVRSEILCTQPLPSVEEVFSVVQRETQRHATMMDGTAAPRPNNLSNQSLNSCPFTQENEDDLKCTFYGQTCHTKDMYFAKHGVPDWFPELKKKLRIKEAETTSNDLSQTLLTHPTHCDSEYIATVNGTHTPVVGVGTVYLTLLLFQGLGGENTVGNMSWLDLEGDVIVEQCAEPRTVGAECTMGTECTDYSVVGAVADVDDLRLSLTEPIRESWPATVEESPVVQQPLAEPNTPSLSSSKVSPNTSFLNMPKVSIVNDCVTNPSNNVSTYKLPLRQN
ncbi:hypothetical protein D8674_031445 [Pyrus ussuriensis x Pyrus communis]|uniref:Retrotransposon Copia-like N-terminal domain-containing protein n=1 Tax=Pyrus ussuriensis x Pyrus communis TaxID=2448454 RepID=A0A5N5EZ38_9ROSA|nr:hypothetical protein D8674_031445 [Pyrus ussuriensis x Pyrus communis]